MPTIATNTVEPKRSEADAAPPRSCEKRLIEITQAIVAYSHSAKVLHFRYCPRTESAMSQNASLFSAVEALFGELQKVRQKPPCQALAVELLRDLASLCHQPPCQNESEQRLATKVIQKALIELR